MGDNHYNGPVLHDLCAEDERCLITTLSGRYPHTDDGVEVRRIFHELRWTAIENFNEQFKAIFDVHRPVPTRGRVATRRYVLAAVFVYQLVLLHRCHTGQSLRTGLKACLLAG